MEENKVEENEESKSWVPRKSARFINLSKIKPEEPTVYEYSDADEPVNYEKIQFKCQPKIKDSDHNSLDNISPGSPIKEIIYRILVNHKRAMKLGDIVERTLEIVKKRKPPFRFMEDEIHKYFYKILTEDTYYGFEEIK